MIERIVEMHFQSNLCAMHVDEMRCFKDEKPGLLDRQARLSHSLSYHRHISEFVSECDTLLHL